MRAAPFAKHGFTRSRRVAGAKRSVHQQSADWVDTAVVASLGHGLTALFRLGQRPNLPKPGAQPLETVAPTVAH